MVVPRKFLSIIWFVFVFWFSEVWCKIFVLRCNSCLCVQLDGGWCKICSETFLFHLICDFTTTSPNFWDIALKKKEYTFDFAFEICLQTFFLCFYWRFSISRWKFRVFHCRRNIADNRLNFIFKKNGPKWFIDFWKSIWQAIISSRK